MLSWLIFTQETPTRRQSVRVVVPRRPPTPERESEGEDDQQSESESSDSENEDRLSGSPVESVASALEEMEIDIVSPAPSVGAVRAHPCEGCVRSHKQGHISKGMCRDQLEPGRSGRCAGCGTHACKPA